MRSQSPTANSPYSDAFHRALQRRGVRLSVIQPKVRLLLFRPGAKLAEGKAVDYGRTRALPLSPKFLLDLARARAEFVLCLEYGPDALLAAVAGRALGRKVVLFQEHSGRAGTPLTKRDVAYRRFVARLVHAFVANTPAARDELVGTLGVDPTRVSEVQILVPPEREDLLRARFDPPQPSDRPVFLYVGSLLHVKNVRAVVEAAKRVADNGGRFEAWIAGDGIERPQLRELAAGYGLDEIVRFLGPVPYPALGHVYDAADVFVMPSLADYKSVAVMEAMRFGKPVIDSAGDGNAGTSVIDGFNGFVFDPARPEELAERMARFIEEPALATVMGERSRDRMSAHTPDIAARRLIDVLERLR